MPIAKKLDKVIKSFLPKKMLNPLFWTKKGELRPEVRIILIRAAASFIHAWPLEELPEILDVTFTGSLAAFNWSSFSDIDLHVVIRYSDVNDDVVLVDKFFALVKFRWNRIHDIKLHGFEVETYVEDVNNTPISTGVFSVMKNEWIKEPTYEDPDYDEKDVTAKANYFINVYQHLLDMFNKGARDQVIEAIDKIKEKIKRMRKSGLQKGGEFSVENLAFKVLRRTDILEKMNDLQTLASDKKVVGENE